MTGTLDKAHKEFIDAIKSIGKPTIQDNDYIHKLARFLIEPEIKWHISLQDTITNFLQGNYDIISVDKLMMDVSKRVDIKLKDSISNNIMSPIPQDVTSAIPLLNYAVNRQFIKSNESIYTLLFWFFKESRNTSHHEFTMYPYRTLILHMLVANEALEQIERLLVTPYGIQSTINYDDINKIISIQARIFKPDTTPLPTDAKVDAELVFFDRIRRTVPLTFTSNGLWEAAYSAKGQSCGPVWLNIGGVDGGNNFRSTSGGTATVTLSAPTMCPHCQQYMPAGTWSCSKCGKGFNLY